uniref:Ovule protein n=1 Tax=Syphacia muris TaxID=451379 RepID=A0A0N5ATR4_9BILA
MNADAAAAILNAEKCYSANSTMEAAVSTNSNNHLVKILFRFLILMCIEQHYKPCISLALFDVYLIPYDVKSINSDSRSAVSPTCSSSSHVSEECDELAAKLARRNMMAEGCY